jgi:antitoxin MazE
MTMLTRIGNSQGIRIPKPLIAQAHLENAELTFEVVENGLLIKPIITSKRENGQVNIEEVLSKHVNQQDTNTIDEFLNDGDLEDYEW